MSQYRITHIRPDGRDADRRIDAVQVDGTVYAIDTVINWIRNRQHQFWVVSARGPSVWVVARQHAHSGRWYLTTEGDGFPPNNLLSLPHC